MAETTGTKGTEVTPAEIAIGDIVVARWETPKGATKHIRGTVIEMNAKKIKIKYLTGSSGSSSFSFSVKEVWRPREQVRKVKRRKGEGDPGKALGNLVYAMAGREPPPELKDEPA